MSTSRYLISVNSLHLDRTGASKNQNSDTKDLDQLAIRIKDRVVVVTHSRWTMS